VRCAYAVEFRTAEGEALAISIPRSEATVIRHFQERMPYGLRAGGADQSWPPLSVLGVFARARRPV
jgi:hypothetical protein